MVITRCTNNYGPYQFPEKVIPLFVTNLLDGLIGAVVRRRAQHPRLAACRRPLPARSRSCSSAGRAGEIYNIGGGIELTNRDLTERLLDACGRDWSSVTPVEDRKGHDRRYSLDDAKLRAELGYAPQVRLRRRAWPRPCSGIATTSPGGARSSSLTTRMTQRG